MFKWDRLACLVVKASTSGAPDPGFESHFRGDFSRWSHTSDFKIGTPVAALPGVVVLEGQRWDWLDRCQYTGLAELESLICNLYLSVAAGKTV